MASLSAALRGGIGGTLGLRAFESFEHRVLGREPVYSPRKIAKRMLGTTSVAPLLRWTYGPAAGALLVLTGAPPLLFALGLAAFELWAMPRAGATPRPSRWKRGELPFLFAHTAAFSLAAALAARSRRVRTS
jgi:hypothetical protein